jgi:hypothetical protein
MSRGPIRMLLALAALATGVLLGPAAGGAHAA